MNLRLLGIFAHPDDESFAMAGIAKMYAEQGAEIALVTATRGDAGRAGEPPLCSRRELPARREAELREAARILGIGHVTVLNYLDKHLAVPPWDVTKSPDLGSEPGVDFLIDITPCRETKAAALRAHRTQHVSIDRHFFNRPDVDKILSVETFRPAFGPPLSTRPATDRSSPLTSDH